MSQVPEGPRLGRLGYVIPNAITCCGMLIGLWSITYTLEGRFEDAAWLILLCVLIDKLDGTAARLLRASTEFGVQLDSFSDFVTFGIAPAVLFMGLMGSEPHAAWWAGSGGSVFVKFSAAFFIIMAALRLAKFNVLTEAIGSKLFLGIPTTLTGALSGSWALTVWKYDLPSAALSVYPVIMVILGLWMVSNVPMPKIGVTSSKPFNIFMVFNAVATFTFVPMRIMPEYLFGMSALWAVVGTAFALLAMDKPVREAA